MNNISIKKIGMNRGTKRIWIEGRLPASAGFEAGTRYGIATDRDRRRLTLRLSQDGQRVVSQKTSKSGVTTPIIDLNSHEILAMFAGLEQVRVIASKNVIHILPVASDVRASERLARLRERMERGENLKIGSLSHGVGVLSLATHDGLSQAGIQSDLSWACDIEGDVLEQAARHNPAWTKKTIAIDMPMQELAFDTWAMGNLPSVDVLEAGLPCLGASVAGRAKKGTSCAEEHEAVGHLVVAFLAVIAKVSPSVVLLENVPPYQSSASMWVIRHQLRDLGYEVHETVLDGADWNALEHRKRMCMVAVTKGLSFSFDDVRKPARVSRRLAEVLEDIPEDANCWSEMQYLRDKEIRDKAAGKGFAMQIVDENSDRVGTIGTGYSKNRSTEPKLRSKHNPDLLRLLTPTEHCAVKGIVPQLIEGLSATQAHSVLGRSIIPAPFISVACTIGEMLKYWVSLFSTPAILAAA